MSREPSSAWTKTDTQWMVGIGAFGTLVRIIYTYLMELSPYDPWRHLSLFRNLSEGKGFVLFGDAPYFWYQPVWHVLAAFVGGADPIWVAVAFSSLCAPLTYLWLRNDQGPDRQWAAIVAAGLMAAWGPAVRMTCHHGPEAFALALMLFALWLALRRESWVSALGAGLLIGLALLTRMHYVFLAPLFVPVLVRPARALAVVALAAAPLALGWLRNWTLIHGDQDFVFAWDGLAIPTGELNVLSSFVPQFHPDVARGLATVHDALFTQGPEWLVVPELLVFMVIAGLAVLFCRRIWFAVSFAVLLGFLLLVEKSGTGNFFRIWICILPVLLGAVALSSARLSRFPNWGKSVAIALPLLIVAIGVKALDPPQGAAPTFFSNDYLSAEAALPPEGMLKESSYFAGSGFYHPESMIFAFPQKRFIGMPWDSESFHKLRRDYPDIQHVVWHDLGVQYEMVDELLKSGELRILESRANRAGRAYFIFEIVSGEPAENSDEALKPKRP